MEKNLKIKLYQKLREIQKQILGLEKDTQGHNCRYVSGAKVLTKIKPLMNSNQLLLKQEVISCVNTRMDYGQKSEILSQLAIKFTWVDCETGETDENMWFSNGQNGWDKGIGSALTYAERYFLLKYFHIATDEDDIDNPNLKPEEKHVLAPKLNPAISMNPSPRDEVMSIPDRIKTVKDLSELTQLYNSLTLQQKEFHGPLFSARKDEIAKIELLNKPA